jgi:hypothetical protein
MRAPGPFFASSFLPVGQLCACLRIALSAIKITIPAVKITPGSTFCPLLPDEPNPCLSLQETLKLEPIDCTLFPCPIEADHDILSHHDPEFGEFLLDAVDWL